MPLIEYTSQCPNCPARAINRFDPETLRTALEGNEVKLYCHYCDRYWKASPEDKNELARKLAASGV
jgi:hypothetical protein